mmetsp:Transcript_3681/g.14007  ORF Transcript_3681/g.14007 Transcript_3681/m.14007 type:complete len:117 (-) Transcript_3681:62-412(-)|eukprot:CAMPEP_0117445604 /NCGR_PEP_ID=MMETSP0759-20121206/5887_1 /TAXON_ID=63605 /ORGANISM="Percolomonas cosmopolitus, Strain WS" /LENGTH=116 /DNA_ID=CAMNT_0005237797 /DNA_START=809 /DNA_END=1159 /DNA_ORIENTATION=+
MVKIQRVDSPYSADLKIFQDNLTIVTRQTVDAVIQVSDSKYDEDEEGLVWVVEGSELSEAVRVFFTQTEDEADISIARAQSKFDIQWNNKDKIKVVREAEKKAKARFEEMLNPSTK